MLLPYSLVQKYFRLHIYIYTHTHTHLHVLTHTCIHIRHFFKSHFKAVYVPLNSSFENVDIYQCNWINWFECRATSFFGFWRNNPHWARVSLFTRFLDHTQRRTTVGRTPLDEWLARRRDLYLTTHYIHNRQTSMLLVGFEHTISAGERP